MGNALSGRRRAAFQTRPTSAAIPAPSFTPIVNPAQFGSEPRRHLIYHIWPTQISNAWRWNVRQLRERIELFNGVRTIGVATDEKTDTLEQVQAAFAGVRIDNWVHVQNNPTMGEGATFVEMLRTLPTDGVTFYGHAKGVKYDPRHEHSGITRRWTDLMYHICLDNWTEVRRSLDQFPLTGPFKRYGDHDLPGNHRWHYSGTFFWFRNADIFAGPWEYLHPNFYGCVEAWPGFQMPGNRSGCLFGENAGFLYLEPDLQQQERAIASWPPLADRTAGNDVSDRQFFQEQINAGLTTDKWPELRAIHARGAQAVSSLGNSILELGSGLGAFLLGAGRCGLDVYGMGASQLERDFAISKGVPPERYQLANLTTYQIPRAFEVIVCVEVFEHLTDAELAPICRQLSESCRWFYFSSTPHPAGNDAEWGHVNVKSKGEWIEFFARFGLHYSCDDRSVTEWGMVFQGAL